MVEQSDDGPSALPQQHMAESDESEADWDRIEASDASKKIHALFSNRIFVQPDGLHLRITFGERVEDESIYHSSIVVPNADAVEFGRLIVKMAEASLENQLAFFRAAIAEIDAQQKTQVQDVGEA